MKTYLKDLTPEEVIKRLKAGEVVKYNNDIVQIKYIDGVLCKFSYGKIIEYNTNFSTYGVIYYFETSDELKLEVGKCYKTRDGRKAFINCEDLSSYSGCVVGSDEVFLWGYNGLLYENQENDIDLISEWSDDDVAED